MPHTHNTGNSTGPKVTRSRVSRFCPHWLCYYTHIGFGILCLFVIISMISTLSGRLLIFMSCLMVLVFCAWKLVHWLTRNRLSDARKSAVRVTNNYRLEQTDSALLAEPDLPTGRGVHYLAAYDKITDLDEPLTHTVWVTRPWVARAAAAADILVLSWIGLAVFFLIKDGADADAFIGSADLGTIASNILGFLVIVGLETLHWKATRKVTLTGKADPA